MKSDSQVTNQQILEKAIQKAIGGGWKAEFTAKDAVREWKNYSTEDFIDFKPVEYSFSGERYADIIFNHDFYRWLHLIDPKELERLGKDRQLAESFENCCQQIADAMLQNYFVETKLHFKEDGLND